MKNNQDWWHFSNLQEQEKEIRETDNIKDLNNKNDFASYRQVLEFDDVDRSNLASHNDVNPNYRIELIAKLIGKDLSSSMNIIDMGCGAGFISNCISNVYSASKVVGVDISKDAIKYAAKKFDKPEFICDSIDPKKDIYGLYDLVFCIEFYPFSRTYDIKTHEEYLTYFMQHLNNDGAIVINQIWENDSSLYSNINEIIRRFPEYTFTFHTLPHGKILKYIKNIYLSHLFEKIAQFFLLKK